MKFNEQSPIYLQIADYIMDMILSKQLNPGERIKSVRELAAEIEVNPNTVVRTYGFLSDQEIVYNKRGVGYFLSEDALDNTIAFRKARFLKDELPPIYKTMDLLNISFEDIIAHYKSTNHEDK